MRIVFLGTGAIGLPALRMLLGAREHQLAAVVTQPDKPVGRRQELQASPIKQLALEHGIAVLQPRRIRDAQAVAELAALKPEVIVVMAYGQILPAELLNVPPVACLNLHASLLPRWRGAAPISATIAAGETETGITVMFMDEGLDTGDILLRKMIPIRRRETAGTLHDRLAALAPEALREALELLGQHCAPRAPQNDALATHAPKLSREDGRIEWSSPAVVIERKIRALNPWPSAHTTIKLREEQPQVLKIFSAIVSRKKSGKPGAVLSTDKSGILVACGEGSVLLCDLQLEGRRRMSAREFLLGHPLPEGLVFS